MVMDCALPKLKVPIEELKPGVGIEGDIFAQLLAPELGVVVGVAAGEH